MIQAFRPLHADPPAPALGSSKQYVAAIGERLRTSPYLSLRRLTCSLWQGKLVLRGEVPTFYLKQVAQSVARSLWTNDILDEVKVAGPVARSSRTVGRKRQMCD